MIERAAILRECPASGRRATIVEALERLHDVTGGGAAMIVEVGTLRDSRPIACDADGWATRIWAWYAAKVGGRCITIDTDPAAVQHARDVCAPWLASLAFVTAPAESVAGALAAVDLLYMDGPAEPDTHLRIYEALWIRPRLVLFDDILDATTYQVKGALAIPRMVADGYEVLFVGQRQALLRCR